MMRVNILLAVALLGSAFWLIRTSSDARGFFVQLERARNEEQELAVEFDRLKVERRSAATPLVVEGMVRNRLHMTAATPEVTHYVTDAGARAASGVRP